MIIYFSATGNSKFAARQLAEKTGDRAVSIEEISGEIYLEEGETLGFVTPTYFFGLPVPVEQFLEEAVFTGGRPGYVFTAATYGTFCGQAPKMAERLLQKKGFQVNARFSIQMPDTWTPVFDLSDEGKVKKALEAEPKQLEAVAKKILARAGVKRARRQVPEKVVDLYHPNYDRMRSTKYLWTTDRCTGCGKCAENCPTHTIVMKNSRPFWPKSKCAMCLRCLHNCPVFAMQYSTLTMNHGQYTHPEKL